MALVSPDKTIIKLDKDEIEEAKHYAKCLEEFVKEKNIRNNDLKDSYNRELLGRKGEIAVHACFGGIIHPIEKYDPKHETDIYNINADSRLTTNANRNIFSGHIKTAKGIFNNAWMAKPSDLMFKAKSQTELLFLVNEKGIDTFEIKGVVFCKELTKKYLGKTMNSLNHKGGLYWTEKLGAKGLEDIACSPTNFFDLDDGIFI